VTDPLVLLADADPDSSAFAEANLSRAGFRIVTAPTGEAALSSVGVWRPALALLDVELPGVEGVEVCRRLRDDPDLSWVPIVMITAPRSAEHRLASLSGGADDFVVKPYDPVELVARVRATLRRVWVAQERSPLTGLPGAHMLGRALARAIERDQPWALIRGDLTQLRAFNERYGVERGNGMVLSASRIMAEAGAENGALAVCHLGEDDFLLLVHPDAVSTLCEAITSRFDAGAAQRYDPDDCAAGFIELVDRAGRRLHYPIIRLALGVAWNRFRPVAMVTEALHLAGELCQLAKREPRSSYRTDRRASRT